MLGNALGGLFGADAAEAAAPGEAQGLADTNDADAGADDLGGYAGGMDDLGRNW